MTEEQENWVAVLAEPDGFFSSFYQTYVHYLTLTTPQILQRELDERLLVYEQSERRLGRRYIAEPGRGAFQQYAKLTHEMRAALCERVIANYVAKQIVEVL